MGILMEHTGNRKKNKNTPPLSQNPKGGKKNTLRFLIGCMPFLFFQNGLSWFSTWTIIPQYKLVVRLEVLNFRV
jgi:hypothetical protein